MSYLLDTCIISKLTKIRTESDQILQSWILSHPENSYYISVLTIGEIQTGISKLGQESSKKKKKLEEWLLGELIPRFQDRILDIDSHTTSIWGVMKAESLKHGYNLPVVDSLLAATALQHNLILVTENTKDFKATKARVFNPLS